MCMPREIRLLFAVTPDDSASAHFDIHCHDGCTALRRNGEDQKSEMLEGEKLQGLEPHVP